MIIRRATAADIDRVVALNRLEERWVGEGSAELFSRHLNAPFFRVAAEQESISAFLFGLGPSAEYDSPNYRWFQLYFGERPFWYVDRVVVDPKMRGQGIAPRLYCLMADESRPLPIAAEVDHRNGTSIRMHERLGFSRVGENSAKGHRNVMYVLTTSRP